nr:FISUMP domain-containing protein [Saprospiraceae bacterium]
NPMKCDTFGGLYQWFEAVNYDFDGNTQGLCPTGWHVATDNEYKNLEISLGMTQAQADAFGLRGTNQGSMIAFYEPIWVDGPLDMDPDFETGGLALLPSGYQAFHAQASLWTANYSDPTYNGNAIAREIQSLYTGVLRFPQNDQVPYAVRCIKD